MAIVLLDTTVLIDTLRGRPVADRICRHLHIRDVLVTTPVNVEEVARGLSESEQDAGRALFDGLTVISIVRADGEQAGRWRNKHAQSGITLHQADCLIAAVAVRTGARLATGNPKDFPMPELDVQHWPVGA